MPSSSMRCMRATLRLVWRASACYTRAIHPSISVCMYVALESWTKGTRIQSSVVAKLRASFAISPTRNVRALTHIRSPTTCLASFAKWPLRD
jgi:hypothetical protein